ncbi:MAG: hypothetical protein Kow00121_33060 [Elainellaceae cyanobacterium]
MSQQGNFIGGFLLGTVVGGVVGGIAGVLVTSRINQAELSEVEGNLPKLDKKLENKGNKKRPLKVSTEQDIELARRGLEDKIAQLNEAIDDVRQQLGAVNGTVREPIAEQSPARDV